MHDSEQEHRGITGCRVTYESTIFYNEANKFSIIVVKTSDPRIPPQACNGRYYGDRMLRFTAVGYELPRTKAVELELDGEWVENKYGYQLQVEQWQEIVPQTADGLLAYLGSGLIKGIGPKTAEDIVATFGPDTLNILDIDEFLCAACLPTLNIWADLRNPLEREFWLLLVMRNQDIFSKIIKYFHKLCFGNI